MRHANAYESLSDEEADYIFRTNYYSRKNGCVYVEKDTGRPFENLAAANTAGIEESKLLYLTTEKGDIYCTDSSAFSQQKLIGDDNHVDTAWDHLNLMNQDHTMTILQAGLELAYETPKMSIGTITFNFGWTWEYITNNGVQNPIPLQKLLPHYTELEELTILKLNPSEAKKLNTMIRYLKEAIQTNSDLLFYHEAIKTQASAFAFCFLNILCSGLDLKNSTQHTTHFRQQDYVRQFMSLLNLHYREQRRVTFYSEQMHITPKYLGSIVTHQTGRTVSDWIDHFVISEAKMLLGYSNLTIQEITYKLNFPNQSFFCKYFKSHTGMTPSEFRSGKQ